jgi:tetraacyldisaccharide-1-P 4'-kinase
MAFAWRSTRSTATRSCSTTAFSTARRPATPTSSCSTRRFPAAALNTLFPRGYLREPVRNALRATAFASAAPSEHDAMLDAMWIGADTPLHISTLLHRRKLSGAWRVPVAGESPEEAPLRAAMPEPFDALRRERCFWMAGVAHPERFAASLRAEGLDLAGGEALRDHEPFSETAIAALAEKARAAGATLVLATEKDAVKLLGRWPAGAPPLHAIRLDVELVDPDAWVSHCLEFERAAPEPEASIFYQPNGEEKTVHG